MGQIMRLRRIAIDDYHIVDRNNGERHEAAFTGLVRDYGLNYEAELLSRSYGGNSWFGKFHPAAGKELLSSLPAIVRAVLRGKVTPRKALLGEKIPSQDLKAVQAIYDKVESRPERYELNLYVSGYDDESVTDAGGATSAAGSSSAPDSGNVPASTNAGGAADRPSSPDAPDSMERSDSTEAASSTEGARSTDATSSTEAASSTEGAPSTDANSGTGGGSATPAGRSEGSANR
jgi:hypothetical protein